MNWSEQQFERVCRRRRVPVRRLPPREDERTADYLILLGRQRVVVEVKQLDWNPSDRRIAERFSSGKVVVHRPTGTSRLRKQIKDGSDQLKRTAKGRCPTLLVVYDNTGGIADLGGSDFLHAMYGSERIEVAVPADAALDAVVTGRRFGGGRSFDERRRTYVSALGWLRREPWGDSPEVVLYHNAFAQRRLPSDVASALASQQYELGQRPDGSYQEWVRL